MLELVSKFVVGGLYICSYPEPYLFTIVRVKLIYIGNWTVNLVAHIYADSTSVWVSVRSVGMVVANACIWHVFVPCFSNAYDIGFVKGSLVYQFFCGIYIPEAMSVIIWRYSVTYDSSGDPLGSWSIKTSLLMVRTASLLRCFFDGDLSYFSANMSPCFPIRLDC